QRPRCPSKTLLQLIGASFAAALVLGVVYHFVARWFDLFLVFPAGLGLVVGGVAASVVTSGKCRHPVLALTVGLLAGVFAYGTRLFMDSRAARAARIQMNVEEAARDGVPEAVAREVSERLLTPWYTFKKHLQTQ